MRADQETIELNFFNIEGLGNAGLSREVVQPSGEVLTAHFGKFSQMKLQWFKGLGAPLVVALQCF